jgi:hypothetical protein
MTQQQEGLMMGWKTWNNKLELLTKFFFKSGSHYDG